MIERKTAAALNRMWLATRGTAAIEFAFIVPILLVLTLGVVEVGYSTYQAMQVQDSAEAGAIYVAKHGWNSAAITAAVVNATGLAGITASPAPSQFCGCPTVSGVTTAVCASTCASGSRAGQYVEINAALTRQIILPASGLLLPTTLTGRAIVRVQ
jgi:Flp pilus assembly protein TadG